MTSCAALLATLAVAVPSTELFERSRPAFRIFTTADGLPQNTVQALALDRQGHLWVGTQGGLAVAEGGAWRTVGLPGDRTSRIVRAILPASDGALWVATSGSGVFRLRDRQWMAPKLGLPSADVNALAEAHGSIWAGTTAGLARHEGGRWVPVTPMLRVADPGVYVLYRTAEPEALWVGTESGLLRWQEGAWMLFDSALGLPDNRVRSLLETRERDGSRTLWVGTDGGLARMRGGRLRAVGRSEGLPTLNVSTLAETKAVGGDPSLWVGMYGGGAAVFRHGRWRVFDKSSGLPDNLVLRILATSTPAGRTMVWIGCDEGLVRLVEGGFRWFPEGPAFLQERIHAMLPQETGPARGIWAASDSGLWRFEGGRWAVVPMPVRKDDRPYSLLAERDGSVLVGTEQGEVLRFASGHIARVPFPAEAGNTVRSLAEVVDPARGPELWVARRNGLLVRRGGRWITYGISSGLKSNWHMMLASTVGADGRPTVWVGGWGGLSRLEGERWITLDRSGGLPDNVVTSLLPLMSGDHRELWLGTNGGAVRMDLDHPGRWTTFSERSVPPLPGGTVHTVQADRKGRVYFGTDKGVVRLSARGDGFSALTYASEDGLPSPECLPASMVDSAGRLWVGTAAGLAVFDPALEPPDDGPKPLVIERTLVRGRVRDLDGASLRYRENALEFEYSLLSYFRDDETRFRTQLVGLDDAPTEWSPDAKRAFTTLPAGRYEFRVWGRDHAGNVSGPVMRRFLIARAPWASLWAIALYALALAGLVLGAVKLRTRALQRRAEFLEEKVAARIRQLDDKNHELLQANDELLASQRQADHIFSALADALEGKVIDGRYRLDQRIGHGGFGAVFRATDLTQNAPVALKVFRPQAGNASTEAQERFRQEAQSSQRVSHKNAVVVLGSGVSSDGILYVVMELLDGRSLRAELEHVGKLSSSRAVVIAVQILEALAEAHRNGIIHRDVKPENVFLHSSPAGEVVKVIDFGVAKDAAAMGRSLTMTGGVVGTPVYMAPERLQEISYDGRSDVYSAGIVLYEMLLGHPPFESKDGSVFPLVMMHVKQSPQPPREVDPSIPASVSDLVLAALAKDAARRPSAERLAELLAETRRPEHFPAAEQPSA